MVPVGHVSDRPALEIAVVKSRQLAQERHAKPGLELATVPQGLEDDRQLYHQHDYDKREQRQRRPKALDRRTQLAGHVEETAEEHRLQDQRPGSDPHRRHERQRRHHTVLAQQSPYRGDRRFQAFTQRRRQLGRKGRFVGPRRCGRPQTGDLDKNSAGDPKPLDCGIGVLGVGKGAPVGPGDQRIDIVHGRVGLAEQGGDDACSLRAIAESSGMTQGLCKAYRGVQGADCEPTVVAKRLRDQPIRRRAIDSQIGKARAKGRQKVFRSGPGSPRRGIDRHLVAKQLPTEISDPNPPSALRRVHHLDP